MHLRWRNRPRCEGRTPGNDGTLSGHKLPVGVVVQFGSTRSRSPSLNGRSPESNLRRALPQPGQEEPVIGRVTQHLDGGSSSDSRPSHHR
ncbi:hypothetical protein LMG28140_06774 [Paraburkholderia metrosideri]|uniref:Uncharacterized protein n=1 Tax=Paraburkholderia metrosideri TaxID=580937 RepID=A0ABM8P9S1_9BURK|nr:hypothetical protein LMG28140_06774 [Paraburkholderia metrosideri]